MRLATTSIGWLALLFLTNLIGLVSADDPLVRVFSIEEIGRNGRAFAIERDDLGWLYVACVDDRVICVYDGQSWSHVEVPCAPTDLACDREGRIWVAGGDTIGYIERDPWGRLGFQLFDVETEESDINNFSFVESVGDRIRFFNRRLIVEILTKDVPKVDKILRAREGERFYAFNEEFVFSKTVAPDVSFKVVGEQREELCADMPSGFSYAAHIGTQQVAITDSWTKVLAYRNGQWEPFSKRFDRFGKDFEFNWAAMLQDGNLGVATSHGFFKLGESGDVLLQVTPETGLPQGNIIRFGELSNNEFWFAHGTEFTLVNFDAKDGGERIHLPIEKGAFVWETLIHQGNLLIGDSSGLYRLALDGPRKKQWEKVRANAHYYIVPINDTCFVTGGNSGLFLINQTNETTRLSEKQCLGASNFQRGCVAVHIGSGDIELHRPTAALLGSKGSSTSKPVAFNVPIEPSELYIDSENRIWMISENELGVAISEDGWRTKTKYLSRPVNLACHFESLNDQLVLIGEGAFFSPRLSDGKIELDRHEALTAIEPQLDKSQRLRLVECDEYGVLLAQGNTGALYPWEDDKLAKSPVNQWILPKPGPAAPTWDAARKKIWTVCDQHLTAIDIEQQNEIDFVQPAIRLSPGTKLQANGDLLVSPKGNVTFDYAVPLSLIDLEPEYQYKLEGLGDWSDWTSKTQKEFARLPGGRYRLQVRAKYPLGTSEIVSTPWFQVSTPWYRTTVAWLSYGLIGVAFFYSLVNWRTRSLAASNQKMERLVNERTEEIKRQQREIQRKSELLIDQYRNAESERIRSFDTLVAGIAHDFNNLLTVISINNEIIVGSKDDLLARSAKNSQKAIEAAAELCRELSAVSDATPMSPEAFSVVELLRDMKPLLSKSVPNQIKLNYDLDNSCSTIFGEPGSIKRAVLNLIVNAGEVAKRKIDVKVQNRVLNHEDLQAARFVSSEPRPGSFVCISIADDGPGIDEKIQSRLFEPFFSTKKLGRGLGLSIVLRIVGRHGGFIMVDSDSGTTFDIFLPKSSAQVKLSSQTTVGAPKCDKLKILLVDDEFTVLEAIRIKLEFEGHEVFATQSAKQSIKMLDKVGAIDLFLIDLSMPEMSGAELADVLLKARPDVPVVFASGFSATAVPPNLLKLSNVAFLRKPFKSHQLLRAYLSMRENPQPNGDVRLREIISPADEST